MGELQRIGMTMVEHNVPTSHLWAGDVVRHYGMRIRLFNHTAYPSDRGTVHRWDGVVLNRDEVTGEDGAAIWPLTGFLRTTGDEAYRWSIQGNDLATWTVERVK